MRFDKGFAGEVFYQYLEKKNIRYTEKLKKMNPIRKILRNLTWCRVVQEDGWIIEEAAFYYRASTWEKPRRVIAIRKTEADPWEENQMCLPELEWKEEVIVTNLAWQPYDIWRIYNQRACMENYIKEAKHGFSIDHIPTQDFDANEADLFLKLIDYKLFELFKQQICDPLHKSYTITRFRREFITIPGRFRKKSRTLTLQLPSHCLHQESRQNMYQCIFQLE